jgi:hypothetical protein
MFQPFEVAYALSFANSSAVSRTLNQSVRSTGGYAVGMQLRYRYRCYPSPAQQQALSRSFGCARVVWNDALALSNKLYGDGSIRATQRWRLPASPTPSGHRSGSG